MVGRKKQLSSKTYLIFSWIFFKANITDTVIKLSSDPKFHNIDDEIKRKVLEHALDFWISFEQVDSTIEIVRYNLTFS